MKSIIAALISVFFLISAPANAMTRGDRQALQSLKDYLRVTAVFPDEGDRFLQAIEEQEGLSPDFMEAALSLIIAERQWQPLREPIDRVLETLPKIHKSNLFYGLPTSEIGKRIKNRLHFVRLRQRADSALKISQAFGLWDEADLPLLIKKTGPENNFEFLNGLLILPPKQISIRSKEILAETIFQKEDLFYRALAYHFDIPTDLSVLIRHYVLLYADWRSAKRRDFPIGPNRELSWLYSRVLQNLHVRWTAHDPQVMEAAAAARRSLFLNLKAQMISNDFFRRFEGPGFALPLIETDGEWKSAGGGDVISLDQYRKNCEDNLKE